MNRYRVPSFRLSLCAVAALCTLGACSKAPPPSTNPEPLGSAQIAPAPAPHEAVTAQAIGDVLDGPSSSFATFESERALNKYVRATRERIDRRYRDSASSKSSSVAPTAGVMAESASSEDADGESITNTQESGVDEGSIVKAHGDHLVVLRRGRLFTVGVNDQDLRPVSKIDVSPSAGHDAWYDEMLIHDDTIVVVGFSYQVGATELGMFKIDDNGNLSRKDTFFLKSNDYYSSRNYASRLLGDKLVFYMPHYLSWGRAKVELPQVGQWGKRGRVDDWNAIIDSQHILQPIEETDTPTLHTVVTCDLSKSTMSCDAQGIVGPAGRNFYVSANAVYVWTHEPSWEAQAPEGPRAVVYRLPLDGQSKIGALKTWGAPVDQFSFKESSDQHLNVLVRAEGSGDAMWAPESSSGDVGLMRVPVAAFERGVSTAGERAFVDLPEPPTDGSYYAFQNRFVGDQLLYGMGSGWGYPTDGRGETSLFVHNYAHKGRATRTLSMSHGVERIEPMGRHAVVIGSDGRNLHFSAVDLESGDPKLGGSHVQRHAMQGEMRSHGFFFKPRGEASGVLGLPTRRTGNSGASHLVNGSADVLFLDVDDLNFRKLGALAADENSVRDDKCTVSCVDWYGNARPIFYKGRVFALLGYELVEGIVERGRLHEVDRVNMLDIPRHRDRPIWKKRTP